MRWFFIGAVFLAGAATAATLTLAGVNRLVYGKWM